MQKLSTPTQDELAERWLRKNRQTIAYGLGSFLHYHNGVWRQVDEDTIKVEILEILKGAKQENILPSNNLLKSVLELCRIQIKVADDRWNVNHNILVCKNGTLSIPTGKLLSHSPKHYATTSVPYDYDPQAQAPNWMRVINNLVPEVASYFQEFSGYSLTQDTRFEQALWLFGPPGNGKSTAIVGLQTMLGEKACVVGLTNIERSRFALAIIIGKTLMVSTEQPSISITVTDQINTIISGEKITIERKFQDPIEIIPGAKMIWAMNDLPSLTSANNGVFRRVQVIKFPPIPEESRDPLIKEGVKLEGPGILNWALVGYRKLYARGGFLIPSSIRASSEEYRFAMDIPAQFLAEVCDCDPGLQVQSTDLYSAYRKWCSLNGHNPKSSTSVANDWRRLGLIHRKSNKGNFWMGVSLRRIQIYSKL